MCTSEHTTQQHVLVAAFLPEGLWRPKADVRLETTIFTITRHPVSRVIDSSGLADTSRNLLVSASPVLGLQEHTIASGLCMTIGVLFCVWQTPPTKSSPLSQIIDLQRSLFSLLIILKIQIFFG